MLVARYSCYHERKADAEVYKTTSLTGVICPDLMSPTNGNVDDQNNRFGGIATYSCMLGYMLDGEAERRCGPDGNWTGEAPSCVRKSHKCD